MRKESFELYDDEVKLLNELEKEHRECVTDESITPHYYDVIFHETSIAVIPEFHCIYCGVKKNLSNERYDWI